jgi:transcriptional regulator with XRE-family HTH domain
MTQQQLSHATGVAQADISRIERGSGNPTEATLQRLAEALGCRLGLIDT